MPTWRLLSPSPPRCKPLGDCNHSNGCLRVDAVEVGMFWVRMKPFCWRERVRSVGILNEGKPYALCLFGIALVLDAVRISGMGCRMLWNGFYASEI
ncbi:hypothetical protein AVEN_138275-1 [Araneus ventricosus]|uniref:Uncharacterized protein n=1 Tax=Araneus ventricosus TaxID=182803 RepID=A0A4Y2V8K2_ARAVE|nr:hypothetical protein AVEN_23003-1 [Araneus ventricosus]GBO20901.1 hypothetical protein AVEN_138275-1 [Araneus ventricosus]